MRFDRDEVLAFREKRRAQQRKAFAELRELDRRFGIE